MHTQSEVPLNIRESYRSDIDGLRAVAVLAVLTYHYWGDVFTGGFIGVDVFFVISGYLLSAIIISDVQAGHFSFSRFYERRIRRIFPALFFLLAISAIFASLFLLPPDVVLFSRSMLASTLSASNFYFWATSNYFEAPAAVMPLLHTWSLAVEEQFYILFPIFIVFVHRYLPKYLRVVVIVVAVMSFVWSVVDVRLDPGAAFFLPFTRVWELLLGTVLALRVIPAPRSQVLRECLAVGGALGILLPIFVLTQNSPFPGENALLPCAGAGAIILAGQDGKTITSRLLSWKPVVFLGLISYSLYLWHWPLLVFSRIAVFRTMDVPVAHVHLVLAILSIVIAAASWRFVETPFRAGPLRPRKRTILIFGAACVTVFGIAALFLSSTRGFSGRYPPSVSVIASYGNYKESYPGEFEVVFGLGHCFLDRNEAVADFDEAGCLAAVSGKKQVLVFGDSHAANLRYGLESSFPNVHFLQATSSACPPTLAQRPTSTRECKQFVNEVVNEYIRRKGITTVLLTAEWSMGDLQNLTNTVDLLRERGVSTIIFGPLPEYDTDLPRQLAKTILKGKVDYAALHLNPWQRILDEKMGHIAEDKWHVRYVSPLNILCPRADCIEYAAPNVPLEFDSNHLTLRGSEFLARAIYVQSPHLFDSE
jgi:peptidoglycan/LPS O-acetylase OafA/YrhL